MIMVPGMYLYRGFYNHNQGLFFMFSVWCMYLYRGFYNLGIMSLGPAASWFASAILIIAALPLGLIFARILTDETFRYCT